MRGHPIRSSEGAKSACLIESTCPYCGVGCGIDVQTGRDSDGLVEIEGVEGTASHPANFGRLCVKGSHLAQTNSKTNRMLYPAIAGHRVSWADALQHMAATFSQIISEHGPDAVAFYVSGQLLTEDYYVANKLMKGFIGSANIDTNSRLCMSSAVSAYKQTLGSDTVPGCYEDLECTELLILVGSNAAWTHPVLYQRIERAKKLNPDMQVVVIDPRKTASCELADLHLAIKPGTDVALFNGLLAYLHENNAVDWDFIQHHTEGFAQCIDAAGGSDVVDVAQLCDVNQQKLALFYRWFCEAASSVTLYSMGVNQSSYGVDKACAIINCHLATGKIGKPGSAPFSITGQPNAMGGREVGGMANMLAAHLDIDDQRHRDYVKKFWRSPAMAEGNGLKAVDLFEQIEQGKIKAVWIMATNPVVSMPNRNKIESALTKCEHVFVSDCVASNDTLKYASVTLPATGWSEKNGTVTNSERRISRQRGIILPTAEARHDWQIICDLAKAMGFSEGFNYSHPAQIFREHAKLTEFNQQNGGDFDLTGLADISIKQYDQLKPVQWPVTPGNPNGTKRMFSDKRFYTKTAKACFAPVIYQMPIQRVNRYYPLVLNTGRLRDQWHTMTRTGLAHQLWQHAARPFVSIHPADACHLGAKPGDLIALYSQYSGQNLVRMPLKIDDTQRAGELFVPIHWSGSWANNASVACLLGDNCDAKSGQPELKYVAVKAVAEVVTSQAMIITTATLDEAQLGLFDSWFKQITPFGTVYWLTSVGDLLEHKQLCSLVKLPLEWISMNADSLQSSIGFNNAEPVAGIFTTHGEQTQDLTWLVEQFCNADISQQNIADVLRQIPSVEYQIGKMICSCFKVHQKSIEQAIENGAESVSELGLRLQCGTNCGSCKPELAQLVEHQLANRKSSTAIRAQDSLPVLEIS